jgi:poly-gamma-glutamate capsule biosynthesis protein CapA/YwtB (metallophosphatase superfamily)
VTDESPGRASVEDHIQKARDWFARARRKGPSSYTWLIGAVVIVVAGLSFALAFTNFIYGEAAHSTVFGSKVYKVEIAPAASADMRPIVEGYIKESGGGKLVLASGPDADVYIAATPRKGYDAVKVTGLPALGLTAGTSHKVLDPAHEYWFSYKRTGLLLKEQNPDVEGLERYIQGYYADGTSNIVTAVGDVIPARHVAEAMAKYGVAYSFKTAVPLVKGSDVAFGDLECPLTDRVKAPYSGMTFAAPAKTVSGLEMLGLNVVTLANNHSTNFGRQAFTDTLKVLKSNNIKYAGGGYDYDEAHEPAVIASKGTRFAFLSYNSIEGSLDATSSEAGVAWIRMLPWSPDNPDDVARVVSDIKEAKKYADVVIPCFHWSEEYKYHPNASMVVLAHKAVDAGADMVIGQHPHTVQSIEVYKGKFIAYSLGNFIFDQRKVEINGVQVGEQTRHGYVLRCDYRRSVPVSLELLPYRINDQCQTIPLKGNQAQALLDKVFEISGWKIQGDAIH